MITNKTNLSLPLQMFLIHDDYDLVKRKKYISATGLLKPIKATVLAMQSTIAHDNDVLDFLASRVGTASHDRLEKAFLNGNHVTNMRKLGYTEDVINHIKINPAEVNESDIPIYLEKRTIKQLHKWFIGGKFDVVMEHTVRDLKTTKVFTWIKNNFEDYQIQGSIYRWLNQDLIKNDTMFIDFIFTDWKAYEAEAKDTYPQYPALSKALPLMSVEETEAWINNKLHAIESLIDADQSLLPDCTDKELWQDPTKYAYFKNPTGKRATKVFDTADLANIKLMSDGSVGKIEVRPGKPKRCNYCSVKESCHQAQAFSAQGLL